MASLGEKRLRDDDNHESSRPRKRPGGASRISKAETEVVQQRQQQRAEEARLAAQTRGVEEVVRQHYNAVPERGREWRKTDSRIKGLRSFNNWVKSTVIHKFSPSEASSKPDPLRVLDIGCGKGGDLQKWQQAPQAVELYVGIDPAEISIEQAKERYRQMRSRTIRPARGGRGNFHGRPRIFDAEFLAEDAFAYSLGDLRIIREVGFGPGSRWGPSGGFDIVSMMFCMHYAFESEEKAKGMLANVSGSLRKGGRFFGVIPNSDIIAEEVVKFHKRSAEADNNEAPKVAGLKDQATDEEESSIDRQAGSKSPLKREDVSLEAKGAEGDGGNSTPAINNLTEPPYQEEASAETDEPPSKRAKTEANSNSPTTRTEPKTENAGTATKRPDQASHVEWGNSIYRVRFPGPTPKDGIFRPPFGWRYSYFMEEAVEEVPEYVVPWEAFRA